jgi:hypothetical protein
MCKILDEGTLLKYAEKAAHNLQIKMPKMKQIKKQINQTIPNAVIIHNGTYQLWVDKSYIAYSGYYEEEVHYIYITKAHIYEEYESYKKARQERKNKIKLPEKTRAAFTAALYRMRLKGMDYDLDKNFFEIG